MSTNIDQDFVEFVVKSLVGKPEAVSIERRIDEKGVLLELTVDPEDLGRVIGKRGATAQSLRTLLRALGTKNDARYNLKIIDNGVQDHAQAQAQQDDTGAVSNTDSTQPSDEDTAVAANTSAATLHDELGLSPDEAAPQPIEEVESDRLSRTRKELAEFDDLDV